VCMPSNPVPCHQCAVACMYSCIRMCAHEHLFHCIVPFMYQCAATFMYRCNRATFHSCVQFVDRCMHAYLCSFICLRMARRATVSCHHRLVACMSYIIHSCVSVHVRIHTSCHSCAVACMSSCTHSYVCPCLFAPLCRVIH